MGFLRKYTIQQRFILLLVLMLAGLIILSSISLSQAYQSLLQQKHSASQQVVETAYSVVEHFHQQQSNGALNEEQAKKRALEVLNNLRYDDTNYFWVNDFTPTMVKATFDNLRSRAPKNHYTVGIVDDVSHTSLELPEEIDPSPEGTVRCKFWGLGADGTVGANKNAIKIIGENTKMYAQAYFAYDAKKSGGITMSHLRFSPERIQSPYLLTNSDFIACHNPAFVDQYDLLEGIKEGGSFLLNSPWSLKELGARLPDTMKRKIAQAGLNFYNIDAVKIGAQLGLGARINMIMQAAFFQIANVIPPDEAFNYMKAAIKKTYGKKGDKVVQMNIDAVDRAIGALKKIKVPKSWATAGQDAYISKDEPEFVKEVMRPMLAQQGDKLPVSALPPDGIFPTATTQYEKGGLHNHVDACT